MRKARNLLFFVFVCCAVMGMTLFFFLDSFGLLQFVVARITGK